LRTSHATEAQLPQKEVPLLFGVEEEGDGVVVRGETVMLMNKFSSGHRRGHCKIMAGNLCDNKTYPIKVAAQVISRFIHKHKD